MNLAKDELIFSDKSIITIIKNWKLHKKLTKTRTNQQEIEHSNYLAHKTRTSSIFTCFQKFFWLQGFQQSPQAKWITFVESYLP
jgi:hypothetical protein